MKITLREGLAFVSVLLERGGQELELDNVILDTGSAGTIFSVDKLERLGVIYETQDPVRHIRGVGGAEVVFTKKMDRVAVGHLQVTNFEIQVGALDYGFDLDGIIGLDFLVKTGARLDFVKMEIR